jgi:hypothetical protein
MITQGAKIEDTNYKRRAFSGLSPSPLAAKVCSASVIERVLSD